ncbi:hypothetical protein TNCV_2586891 [Trichonephila clavipes]|nr:hypothetical protein TNCV_2586891 [Trichonephila clavipes]
MLRGTPRATELGQWTKWSRADKRTGGQSKRDRYRQWSSSPGPVPVQSSQTPPLHIWELSGPCVTFLVLGVEEVWPRAGANGEWQRIGGWMKDSYWFMSLLYLEKNLPDSV